MSAAAQGFSVHCLTNPESFSQISLVCKSPRYNKDCKAASHSPPPRGEGPGHFQRTHLASLDPTQKPSTRKLLRTRSAPPSPLGILCVKPQDGHEAGCIGWFRRIVTFLGLEAEELASPQRPQNFPHSLLASTFFHLRSVFHTEARVVFTSKSHRVSLPLRTLQ